ncbi:unnamed protein product [Acanthoscelides obtectus]|uniref:Uncharacterized protein n=1 Tax=Acanthoscelides obtectus TaxID=200917 RepID=A0A9P0JKW8_ACAOB|nr:unnamed protein product [Acanthoscelides obtectus]CAK1639763.1 hypothetical protein AOBTE_LOCUS11359 [Acanthoscelides obtectus]
MVFVISSVLTEKTPDRSDSHPMDYSLKSPSNLPLSCTNFCTSPDLITNNVTYQKEYIQKYFQNFPEYNVLNFMIEDGDTFPYATINNYVENKNVIADLPQPTFIPTDIGFIPVILDSCKNNHDFSRTSKMYRTDVGSK